MKLCSKMITNIIRYHIAVYYIMSITRDRSRVIDVMSHKSHQTDVKNTQ